MIYQFTPKIQPEDKPFSPLYILQELVGVPEIDARWSDPQVQKCLAEYVGMWYVWKYKHHDWVGFTSNNQLTKEKSNVIFQDESYVLDLLSTWDIIAWNCVDYNSDHSIDYYKNQGFDSMDLNGQLTNLYPEAPEALKLIGVEMPEAKIAIYCNYFAMRWELFDEYMQWSDNIISKMLQHIDEPCFAKHGGHWSTFCAIMERLISAWQYRNHTCICLV